MTLPSRRVSKSKFSMYLRTNCDRELYLSLFSNKPADLAAAGIPVPLKSRPGVQLVTNSGRDFEYEQFDILINALPNNVFHKSNGRAEVDLAVALKSVKDTLLILQPALEAEKFRDFALPNFGVSKAGMTFIPELAGLRPDIVLADPPRLGDHEILPDGSRRALAEGDKRYGLCVIDLKNITEANASYSAEVCLYSMFLSNWLHSHGKEFLSRFFVSDRIYLWRHVELPNFGTVMGKKEGGEHKNRLKALMVDLEDGRVPYLVYMPSVRKFFSEDLPRVVEIGDGSGWDAVPYHVNPKCGSCDWLGNKSWLSSEDKKHFESHPDHYCFHSAEATDHLSKMPTLSRGATNVLHVGGHKNIAALVGIQSSAAVLRGHSLLKKDRTQIGHRAEAITTNAVTIDQQTKIGGLAKRLGAEYDIAVNFDAGSGFLTGIGLRGALLAPYGKTFVGDDDKTLSIKPLGDAAFVVEKDNHLAEWAALQSFVDKLATWIEEADALFKAEKFGVLRTQICFWESRQYEELCGAFGRHLVEILELTHKHQRALAWIFPPDELMEKSDHICPNIIFIKDLVGGSVRLPQRFATTLHSTAEHYHHSRLKPRDIDSYYLEPLGNGIPRERIFEIWKTKTGTVRMFGRVAPVSEAVQRYGAVLRAQAWTIASITARLRADLKDCIEGNAPALDMSISTGLQKVAYDSKLWDRWATVSAAVAKTEGLNALVARPEVLEAAYKAIILTKLINDHGNHLYEFEVSDDSTEAKIEERDWCTVGIVGWPGFPLERAKDLGLDVEGNSAFRPMHAVILAIPIAFDRAGKRIMVQLSARWSGVEEAFDAVIDSVVPIGKEPLYLLQGMPYDDSGDTTNLLRAIGDPPIAAVAPSALRAMGQPAKKVAKGTDADSAPAQVLWNAKAVAANAIRSDDEVKVIATFARTANKHPLNPSQEAAVRACAARQLAIIWGPPGTGKTDTLVAALHAIIRGAKPSKILLSGPNYRAVEELSNRLAANLADDKKAACDYFWLYSKSRVAQDVPVSCGHIDFKSVNFDVNDAEFQSLVDSMADSARITVIATTAHNVMKLTETVGTNNSCLDEIFDIVVLDESSQIPLTLALKPLASLRASGQLIVAGDHMQMPPIHALDPPKGAEYLVGSIQGYFIKRFDIKPTPLLVNYRSNQALVDYARSLGYPPALQAAQAKKDLLPIASIADVVKKLPAGVPTTPAYEELLVPDRRVTALVHHDPTSSQANEIEAGIVAGLAFVLRHAMASNLDLGTGAAAQAFTDDEFFECGIGIVTPHKAQKALVIRKLTALFPHSNPSAIFDAVDTVERFQGSERDTIIVSFGVGDTDIIEGEEEFLLQLERTNVAISRAKAKCIVLMPKTLAYHLPSDMDAARTSVAIKSYLEEFCCNRLRLDITLDGVVRPAEVRWH